MDVGAGQQLRVNQFRDACSTVAAEISLERTTTVEPNLQVCFVLYPTRAVYSTLCNNDYFEEILPFGVEHDIHDRKKE